MRNYLAIKGSIAETLEAIGGLAKDQGLEISAPLDRLARHGQALEASDKVEQISFDAGFSPRLDYYTGLVFEMSEGHSPLASGGEYDRLLQRLGASEEISASGCAVWVDRLGGTGNE